MLLLDIIRKQKLYCVERQDNFNILKFSSNIIFQITGII